MNYAGIDVGKNSLHLSIDESNDFTEFSNCAKGRKALLRRLKTVAPVYVVLEPTAQYHLAIAKDIVDSGFAEVMIANPRTTANYAKAMGQRGKSDISDCKLLALYAKAVEFHSWKPPTEATERLRALMRRRHQLVVSQTKEKVRLREAKHAAASEELCEDIQAHLDFLAVRLKRIMARAMEVVSNDATLSEWRDRLKSIPGVGDVLALVITAELVHLPRDITGRQLTAYSGLDPKQHQSGQRDSARRISRKGNKRLRTALYIAAQVAGNTNPNVKAWKQARLDRGKAPKLVNIAIARRLLHVIVALNAIDGRWDGQKFHRLPENEANHA